MRISGNSLLRGCYTIEVSHITCIWQTFKCRQRRKEALEQKEGWLWICSDWMLSAWGRWTWANEEGHVLYDWFRERIGFSLVCPELEVRVKKRRKSKSLIRSWPFWAGRWSVVGPLSICIMSLPLDSSPHVWHQHAAVCCLLPLPERKAN